ncbi:MAG: hypothetical protein N3G20_02980, partial [Verrucomicrobiae bacterium]|nr:hypothetical protein [Verrucomicrobiae bacterium]
SVRSTRIENASASWEHTDPLRSICPRIWQENRPGRLRFTESRHSLWLMVQVLESGAIVRLGLAGFTTYTFLRQAKAMHLSQA